MYQQTKVKIISLIREYQSGEHWEYHSGDKEQCAEGNCPDANKSVDILQTIAPEEFYDISD